MIATQGHRHGAALDWAATRLAADFGPIARASEPFDFVQTSYYERTMGASLRKQFLVFQDLVDASRLAEIKLRTNALEDELTATQQYPEARPLNLDPGILALGKWMLATTKDQAHRIYLRDGIFAEVTLRPHVTVADASMVDAATAAHAQANEWCFIANSVNFPVRHEPTIEVAAA